MCTRISLVRSAAMHATPTIASYLSIGNSMLWCHAQPSNNTVQQSDNTVQQSSAAVQRPQQADGPLTRSLAYCSTAAAAHSRQPAQHSVVKPRAPWMPCAHACHVAHARHVGAVRACAPRCGGCHVPPTSIRTRCAPAPCRAQSPAAATAPAAARTIARPSGPLRQSPQSAAQSVQVCRDSIRLDSTRLDSTRPDRRRPSADRCRPSGQLAPAGSSAEPSGAQRHPLHPAQPNVLRQVERCRLAHSLLVGAASQHCVLHRCMLLLQRVAAWRVATAAWQRRPPATHARPTAASPAPTRTRSRQTRPAWGAFVGGGQA